ncbi:MAG: restriction endonuclease [Clostridiales bacterium]|nr:restriction endonuclease [Clostridiales bacterium]MCF8023070.1 restriction endonuclease [Clostridiales bacterium]
MVLYFLQSIAHLLEAMGYKTRISSPGPDGGIDIIVHLLMT